MYKKFLLSVVVMLAIVSASTYAISATKSEKNPTDATEAAKSAKKPIAEIEPAAKAATAEDEKYAAIYDKCIKEAEKNEAKYDQLFNSCMDKNGFPQEDYSISDQPIEGAD